MSRLRYSFCTQNICKVNDSKMETMNKEAVNPPIPPPPPPPPPPPLMLRKTQEILCQDNDQLLDAHQEVAKALSRATIDINDPGKVVLSFYRQIKPLIQDGPMCGLVALNMAYQLLSTDQFSIEDVFVTAKELKFTKFGEMFSAENMGILAEVLFHQCKKQVISDVMFNKNNILKHILAGWPVLFPYDSDKNHEPCCQKGQSAHWAILSGLCLTIPHNVWKTSNLPINGEICHFSDGLEMIKFLDIAEDIYVYAHQGKSRHLAAWNFNNLLNSNMNLFEISDKWKNSDMVLPSESDLWGLRNKAVLLSF